MSIRQWPQRERPREKLLERGPSVLTEAELLAILLRTGVRGHSALDVARQLLVEFGSLRGLLTADSRRLCEARGLGPARYVVLQASLELARRHYQEPLRGRLPLNDDRATKEFLQMRLRDLSYEVFCCLWLDNRRRVIAFDELFRGTLDGASGSYRGRSSNRRWPATQLPSSSPITTRPAWPSPAWPTNR